MTSTYALCYIPEIGKYTILEFTQALEMINDYNLFGDGFKIEIETIAQDEQELEWAIADRYAQLN